MPSVFHRKRMLVLLVLLLSCSCHLEQEQMWASECLSNAGQSVLVFVEDFARQVLAAFLF